jgi:hypothetical protein
MIHLIGRNSNRDAIGTRVKVTTGQKTQTRWKSSSSGYLSQSDYRLHFGTGKYNTIDKIEIYWPNGKRQSLTNINVSQVMTIIEPN